MSKIITIDDIKIKSVTLSEDDKVYVYVDYYLREQGTTEPAVWKFKNHVLKETDLTPGQITKVKQIIEAAYKKIKQLEEI